MKKTLTLLLLSGVTIAVAAAGTNAPDAGESGTNAPEWLSRPLPLVDALNIALAQNATILKAKDDLESTHGVVVQTRAIALPQLQATGKYTYEAESLIPTLAFAPSSSSGSSGTGTGSSPSGTENSTFPVPNQNWNTGVQLTQTIYQGGKLRAAIRAATATQEQAIAQYDSAVEDTLLAVRLAYYDVLLAAQQIVVQEASVNLLQKELDDQQHRFDAGTVPHFNLIRAQVQLANQQPSLIHARNQYRITKNNLAQLLGYNLPREVWEDLPLNLVDSFDTSPWNVNLPDAIQQAFNRRTELVALQKQIELSELNIISAKSGYQPTVSLFAGYNVQNNEFTTDVGSQVHGWIGGGQMSWDIFDGLLTHGKVIQAKAQASHAKTDFDDRARLIELEVRTDYSDFIEARETLESQEKVEEQAVEALREANARFSAGTGTQLDVLDAETSLTQARTTQVQAQHDYVAARARLERAMGADLMPAK